ncbi:MAG: SPOR domain-containing protein [Acidobacteriota bacterium]
MTKDAHESSNELVLDNRKLIIAFLLLIVTCGAFFLIGFMEGKRQAQRSRADMAAPVPAEPAAAAPGPADPVGGKRAEPEPVPLDSAAIRSQLEWYQKVNEEGKKAPAGAASQDTPRASPKQEERRSVKTPPTPAAAGKSAATERTAARYTVQVGAFRQPSQAESRAAALRAKGYSCTIDAPGASNDLHLVKVGQFDTRADAVAMQLRLKQDGFSSFIKTIP